MPASRGVRPPFLRIQGAQAVTIFSHVVRPPLERGIMWSKVRSEPVEQYWQEKLSRRNRLKRVKAGARSCSPYCFRETTLGSTISTEGELTTLSYVETTSTRSWNTAVTTSCQGHSDSG